MFTEVWMPHVEAFKCHSKRILALTLSQGLG